MRTITTLSGVILGSCMITGVLAGTDNTPYVSLYNQPSAHAKITKKVYPSEQLIPIYAKGQWLEVGDPNDGQVGWINKKDYMQAVHAATQPHVQTFVFDATAQPNKSPHLVAYHNGKKLDDKTLQQYGKMTVVEMQRQPGKKPHIIAYRNGKKLGDKQAQHLLKQLQRQQVKAQNDFLKTQRQIEHEYQQSMQDMQQVERQMLSGITPVPSGPQLALAPGPVVPPARVTHEGRHDVHQQAKRCRSASLKPVQWLPNPFKAPVYQQ